MDKALEVLHEVRDALKKRLAGIEKAIEAIAGDVTTSVRKGVKKGKMSAATKAKLSKAQKARWAKVRATQKS